MPHRVIRHLVLVFVVLCAAVAPPLADDSSANTSRVRWGYHISWDNSSNVSLQQNVHNLDIVSPYHYRVQMDGTVTSYNVSASAIQTMRDSGAKIIPMVTNAARWDDFTELMEEESSRTNIIDQLEAIVEANDWDGIHIDFEALNKEDHELVTQFQKELSERLWANDRMVTQAVIARLSDTPSVWGGAYNYSELAKYNDLIVIMAYDFTPVASQTPGPVAPIDWVENVSAYAASRIPSEKVLLGVPFYGYDWTLEEDNPDRTVGAAHAMRFDMTMSLQQYDDLDYRWSDQYASPWATYTDDEGHKHEVWFENENSLEQKLNVMTNYDLGGMAAWRLGQEDPGVWDQIGRMATPASRVAPVASTDDLWYFNETGHTLRTVFLSYWLQNGGLPVFGFPQTEEFQELNADTLREHTVQYFERQRYEYHPEHAGTPYEVLLGRLGHEDANRRGLLSHDAFDSVAASDDPDCLYFEVTGQNACGVFLEYWESYGLNFGDAGISYRESLALFGYPVSAPFEDPDTGRTVQYFERARFEHHPENAGTQYEVLLGLLGNEELREKGWIR